jgi:hypothetical protein
MAAIPPCRVAQLRPGADVCMISASARRPALPLSQARCTHILAGAQFPPRSASHSASPADLLCHARNQASHATPHESWGSGTTETPVPVVEVRGEAPGGHGERNRRQLGGQILILTFTAWAREMRNGAGAAGVSSELHS